MNVIKEIKRGNKKENPPIILEKGTSIALLRIDNEQGEHFLKAFTDWDESKKWNQNENQQLRSKKVGVFYEFLYR